MTITLITWTLEDIRDKVRNLTGQLSTANYTDADIDRFINNYYQFVFTRNVFVDRLRTRFQMTIDSDGNDGRYPIHAKIISIEEPIMVDGTAIRLYLDHNAFWEKWPQSETFEEAEPYDVLLFDRELWFRPPPDDSYTVEVVATKMPDKLTNDDDTPYESRWGPAIAYGAAIDILTDQGNIDEAAEKALSLRNHLNAINDDWFRQHSGLSRSKPSF